MAAVRVGGFSDHDLDAEVFALAQAFFHILLGPERSREPGARHQQDYFVTPHFTLRMQESGQLERVRNFLLVQDGGVDPFVELAAGERQRIEAAAG